MGSVFGKSRIEQKNVSILDLFVGGNEFQTDGAENWKVCLEVLS